jgi:hypothetical protein
MDQGQDFVDDAQGDMVSNFQKAFGWYVVINRVTGNDITKHEAVFQKTLIEILNQLTFLIQHDKLQEQLLKKQNK